MKKALIIVLSLFVLWTAAPLVTSEPQTKAAPGYFVERDRSVARNEPGPHKLAIELNSRLKGFKRNDDVQPKQPRR